MTAYNGMWRCEGGQKNPNGTILSSQGVLGACLVCDKYFKLYPNGKIVMHKRKSRA